MILNSLDIIELDIPQIDGMAFTNALRSEMDKFRFSRRNRILDLARRYEFELTDSFGSMFYFAKNNVTVTLDTQTKEINISGTDDSTYALLVPSNGVPFVFFCDEGGPHYLPYEAVSDNLKDVYRHVFAGSEIFVLRATNHFITPDICDALSRKKSNIDIAKHFPGNSGLNYIYIIFGLLGIIFPDSWGTDGADASMLTGYGFEKVQ
jgi:hypothetical protein